MRERNFFRSLPVLDLVGVALLMIIMALFLFCDPFNISHRIIEFLRLNYPIFVQEPKLLFCVSIYIGNFIVKAGTMAFVLLFLAARRADITKSFGLNKPKPKNGWAVFLIPLVILAIGVRMTYAENPLVPDLPMMFILPESMLAGNIIILLSAVIAAPVMEELIFRGYMYGVLERSFGYRASIAATSVIFALAHWQMGSDLIGMSLILAIGSVFGFLRYKYNSVFIPMAFHAAYNFTFMAVGIVRYFIFG